jgi:hypothetical protein
MEEIEVLQPSHGTFAHANIRAVRTATRLATEINALQCTYQATHNGEQRREWRPKQKCELVWRMPRSRVPPSASPFAPPVFVASPLFFVLPRTPHVTSMCVCVNVLKTKLTI